MLRLRSIAAHELRRSCTEQSSSVTLAALKISSAQNQLRPWTESVIHTAASPATNRGGKLLALEDLRDAGKRRLLNGRCIPRATTAPGASDHRCPHPGRRQIAFRGSRAALAARGHDPTLGGRPFLHPPLLLCLFANGIEQVPRQLFTPAAQDAAGPPPAHWDAARPVRGDGEGRARRLRSHVALAQPGGLFVYSADHPALAQELERHEDLAGAAIRLD